ncbi:MAG: carotenoid biosynthesis protein [Candidatus Thorarchaeota archaeon]
MNRSDVIPILFLILMMAVSLPVFLNPPLYLMIIMLILYVVMFFGFVITHGKQVLGLGGISVFFGITALVTYAMEWLGTHFGVPFGHYYYTNQLGPLIMDVPIVIPFQWFNTLYVCYIMAYIILGKRDIVEGGQDSGASEDSKFSGKISRIFATSIVAGLFMTLWDSINDPYMVGMGNWVWTEPMEFFGLAFAGIPLSNFLGWVLTSALTVFLFDLYRYRNQGSIRLTVDVVAEPRNGLVVIPYLYLLVFQATNGITAGVFSFETPVGWAPIALAAVSMVIAVILVAWRYLKSRS